MSASGGFDGERCIEYLLDRGMDFATRLAAAESLDGYPTDQARAALFAVLVDEGDDDDIRDECAGSLGQLWETAGVEYERLRQVDDRYVIDLLEPFLYKEGSINRIEAGPRIANHLEQRGWAACLTS